MLEEVDSKVLKLVRTRIGPLTLEGLTIGKWRELTPGEIRELKKTTKTRGTDSSTFVD
jgi:16S rRNA U516 pseudouridylate synthase RsuA-like enzyme